MVKMSLPVVIGGTCLIFIVALLYGAVVYVSGSGSALAKYTVKKNSTCLSEKTTTDDQNNSSDYTKCMSELEMLVRNLINNGEVNLQSCELEGNNATIAYCQVLTWYRPNTVVVTDSDAVTAITEYKSKARVDGAERRKRNVNDVYAQIVDEDIDVQNNFGKVQYKDLKMQ